jgi:hypothetical protein
MFESIQKTQKVRGKKERERPSSSWRVVLHEVFLVQYCMLIIVVVVLAAPSCRPCVEI